MPVELLVRFQIAMQREEFAAHVTLVIFSSRVREKMILQVGLFGEALGTLAASKWPCALMDVRVTTEITRRGERLVAVGALVWLFLDERESTCRRSTHDALARLSCVSFDGSTDWSWR